MKITRRTVIATATLVPAAAIRSAAQPPQIALLQAVVDRIVPPDELGPGAKDCGAVDYIAPLIDQPLKDGLAAIDAEALAKFQKPFVELPSAGQDEILTALQSRPFFTRLRQLTLEGTFGDPSYGGNRGFAGWDLIRYPGPRLAVSPEEQKLRDPIKPLRKSTGHGH